MVTTKPGFRVAVLASSGGPTQKLLTRFLRISSAKWQQLQEHREIEVGTRSYPVLEMAKGKDVQETLETLFSAFLEPLEAVPQALVDSSLKDPRFRAISSAVSSVPS